ncbi:Alpha/beta hydrolase fold-1 [Microdochium bolleyi]|uniref:Alpha/beta hydrolase fold-1 n=1 Tax=Microdochium bolleyi TaxID=196109 RepID=A0A136JHK4_9PEZI|nr:Alpha/beta hydrolase fold-1 [Microdochium bolleyi]
MAALKPVICLVHGAGHQRLHFRYLDHALLDRGLITTIPQLATSGKDDASATKTHLDDVARVRDSLLPYLDRGHKAIIVGHSYGGRIVTQAAKGLTLEDRAALGMPGGVVALMYMAAFTEKDQPLTPEILGVPLEAIDPATKLLRPEAAIEAMYHDIDHARASEAVALLQRQSRRDLEGPAVCKSADIHVPKRYIACRNDRVIGHTAQLQFAQEAGAEVVAELDCGHSPWLRDDGIRAIVDAVVKLINQAGQL